MNDFLVFNHPLPLGLKAKLLRTSRRLSQEQVASLAEVSQEQVSRFERSLPVGNEAKGRILVVLGLEGPRDDHQT